MARRDKHAARFGAAYTLPRLERALASFGVRVVPWQTRFLRYALENPSITSAAWLSRRRSRSGWH